MNEIIILTAIAGLNILESMHDAIIIRAGLYTPKESQQWHTIDGIYYAGFVILLSWLAGWLLLPALLMSRRVFFDIALNLRLGKPWGYYSKTGIDGIVGRIGGKWMECIVYAVLVALNFIV